MSRQYSIGTYLFAFLVIFPILFVLMIWFTQWAWALFAPSIFGLPYLSFMEAVGMDVFATIMFYVRGNRSR